MRKCLSICNYIIVFTVMFVVSGCDLSQNYLQHDRDKGLEQQDYRDALSSRVEDDVLSADDLSSSALSLDPYISSGYDDVDAVPIVSISVNQSVPLRDILYELAQQADYDIELVPSIVGSIIFSAKERPFDSVIERICDLAGLRYTLDDNVLRVEVDRPYNKFYRINYLSYIRSASGSMNNDINVVSGDGADTGSSFSTTTETEIDFWSELNDNLDQIIGGSVTGGLRTDSNPTLTPGSTEVAGDTDAVVNAQSLPLSGDVSSASIAEAEQGFSINKQAGVISVFATKKTHDHVGEYLAAIEKSVSAQVLIEAKVLEVRLTDEYSAGINWSAVDFAGGSSFASFNTIGSLNDTESLFENFTFQVPGTDVDAVVQALNSFGTVRALASPRLTVINNQAAVMNVADNRVFFEVDIETEDATDTAAASVTIDSEIRNVPEGVLLNVQPSIDLDKQVITMALRPTITRVIDGQPDPALIYLAQSEGLDGIIDESSNVPELNVQEIDSVIRVNSGSAIVLGGLLQDSVTSTTIGVPVLGEIPILGSLFENKSETIEKTELVIVLKATIINDPVDTVHMTDKDLYRRFSGDRRPFKL